jgi:hypothetical protein
VTDVLVERNYASDMRAVIDAETGEGSYAAPIVAEHIVAKLRATDPELLNGWLQEQAVNFLRHAINLRDCSVRTHNRLTARRSVFREAREALENGDPEPMRSNFLGEMYLTEDGTKVPLREMRKAELTYAADDFAARVRDNAMREAFLRALAKKVGKGKVSDHFDEDKLAAMWRSITGE